MSYKGIARIAIDIIGPLLLIIGLDDVSEKISYVPARLEVIKTICPTYACRSCKEHVMNVPLPKMPISKSYAHYSLLAHTISSKYSENPEFS